MKPKFLLLSGDGLNCQRETRTALTLAGAEVFESSLNQLQGRGHEYFAQFSGMIIPGGFSFGDELGAGQLLALKIQQSIGKHIEHFCTRGRRVLGICNGFQVLLKMGLLDTDPEHVQLRENRQKVFMDSFRPVLFNPACTAVTWAQFLPETFYPVRNHQGRLWVRGANDLPECQRLLLYKDDAMDNIAGICNRKGNVLGIMPHPEAVLFRHQLPWKRSPMGPKAMGLDFFHFLVNHN